jgi:endonuclease YncB( thermonuclease family)
VGLPPRFRRFAAALAFCLGLVPGLVPAATMPGKAYGAQGDGAQACSLEAGPVRTVVRVIDAETVLLDDGEEVRLIGALAPRSPDLRPDAPPWPAEERATAALRKLLVGHSVELAFSGRRTDRYGRVLAHLFIEREGKREWVQGLQLSSGNARAYGLQGSFTCLRELLAHERAARDKAIGIWSDKAYAPRPAARPRQLLRLRNSYQIVTGRIAHVAPTKARTYLNFGKDWRKDFTAGVDTKILRAHPELASRLRELEGRRVEVRGWIEYRNGPYIAIEDPDQIEAIEERPLPRNPPPQGPAMSSGKRTLPPAAKEKRPEISPGAIDL